MVMKSIAYNIIKHPRVHKKLVEELDAANLSFPPKHEETRDLPYLCACVKEGQRMHPVISGVLERIVPETGLTLPDGRVLPPGTQVGFNPWVAARNKNVFGDDVHEFKPERWLQAEGESDVAYANRLRKMNANDLTFGAGNRICVGRFVANVEIHKIIPTLFHRYNVSKPCACLEYIECELIPFVDHS